MDEEEALEGVERHWVWPQTSHRQAGKGATPHPYLPGTRQVLPGPRGPH